MTVTDITFFVTVIATENATDLWKAGKCPLLTMYVQNVLQLEGGNILECYTKAATIDAHIFTCSAFLPRSQQAGAKRTRKAKERTKEK